MTAKNAILLIIKQNQGIEYNALLNKISSNYNNINSARAALSRALKDLNALAMVKRQGGNLFATDKGAALLNLEMKNKLLLKLNHTVKTRNPESEIDSIVQQLQTLIERSKEDADLLKAAKGGTDFYISELERIREKIEKRTKHLSYIQGVFTGQITALQSLNFNDSKKLEWNKKTVSLLQELSEKTDSQNFVAECHNSKFFDLVQGKITAKTQKKNIFLAKEHMPEFLKLVEQFPSTESNPINLYFSSVKARIEFPHIYITGAHSHVKQLTKGMR